MSKKINLETPGLGVILIPIFEIENTQTKSGIVTSATHENTVKLWKGDVEVVVVGPDVTAFKPGDRAKMNMQTRNKIAFEHNKGEYVWTLEPALFAKVLPESKIIS